MRRLAGMLILLSTAALAGCAHGQVAGPVDRYGGGRSYLPTPPQMQTRVLNWPGKAVAAPSAPPMGYYPAMQPAPGQLQPAPYGYPQAGYPPAAYYPQAPRAYPQAAYPQAYPQTGYAQPGYPAAGYAPAQPAPANPAPAPAPANIYAPAQGPAASNAPAAKPAPSQALAAASTPRFYSLHRDFGLQPDSVAAASTSGAPTGEAESIPQTFFAPTPNLSDPPADQPTNRPNTTTTSSTTTRRN